MSVLLVTHQRPDLDAVAAVWLVRKFFKGWGEAEIIFVPAGKTYQDQPADSNQRIIHVDTGLGKFDHHQLHERSSAARRVVEHVLTNQKQSELERTTLERFAEVITSVENFEESKLDDESNDFYDLGLHQLLRGSKATEKEDAGIMAFGLKGVAAFYQILKNKVVAELDIAQGVPFSVEGIKCLGILTRNEEALILGQKEGYDLVVRKDPVTGNARIKARPDSRIDLERAYQDIVQKDTNGTWYLHGSHKMLLNGSDKGGTAAATALTLQSLIAILKKTI